MDARRRRQNLGKFASAALPALWKGLARRNMKLAELARLLERTNSSTSKLAYGDIPPDTRDARICCEEFGVRFVLWEKPCAPNWRPHDYPGFRKGTAHRRGDHERAATAAE